MSTNVPTEDADSDADESTDEGTAADATELRGEDLAIGYPATDEPVVECERVVLPAGEITALVGPNGSGKSTLLKALARQLTPECGQVLLDGQDVQTFDEKPFARRVGLLSQENEAPASLTVEDLVGHGRYPYRGFLDGLSATACEAIDRAIDRAGVGHLRGRQLGELSGGQKQLAWIAMILAQETDALLLDEPTTFLDLQHQLRVLEVIRELNAERDVTVAIVLHDIAQAARFADNLVAMRDGGLYDWGPPEKVVTEALLEDVFGVAASVDPRGPDGPQITPHGALE